jgi:hypothetical protein
LSDWKRKVTAEYVPTDAQRSLVESASAFGITQAEIATQLKISEPTLRKHFRDELDGGAFKANMKVGGNMYGLTQSADEQVRLPVEANFHLMIRRDWLSRLRVLIGGHGERPDMMRGNERYHDPVTSCTGRFSGGK